VEKLLIKILKEPITFSMLDEDELKATAKLLGILNANKQPKYSRSKT